MPSSSSQPPPLPADSPLAAFFTTLHNIYVNNIFPHLPPALQTASVSLASSLSQLLGLTPLQSGDIVSLAAFLLVVYLTLRIADYIRRSIFAWIAFLVKIALVLVLVQGALYAQRYGWQKTLADAAWLWGVVWSNFLEEFLDQTSSSSSSSSSSAGTRQAGSGSNGGANKWNLSGGRQQVPLGRGYGGQRRRG